MITTLSYNDFKDKKTIKKFVDRIKRIIDEAVTDSHYDPYIKVLDYDDELIIKVSVIIPKSKM